MNTYSHWKTYVICKQITHKKKLLNKFKGKNDLSKSKKQTILHIIASNAYKYNENQLQQFTTKEDNLKHRKNYEKEIK